jgi:hypothetical protein
MPMKVPTGARFFYFHKDNSEEIKNVWSELAKKTGIEAGEEDAGELIKESFKVHGLTNIKKVQGKKARLSISLYRNIVIISGIFYLPGSLERIVDEIRFGDLSGKEVSIGGAMILISRTKDLSQLEGVFGIRHTKIETTIGELCQFEEKEGSKEHSYFLNSASEARVLEHFLTLDFPVFDFAIHKLHMERDYFRNQKRWILDEKQEIDKNLGEILHKSIVGETLNPQFIGTLEKDIDTISSKYAILVNDSNLVRKAISTLEDDIELVYKCLREFANPPAEGLEILRDSEQVKSQLVKTQNSIINTIKDTKTAIDTVRTNVDLLRSRENLGLQEEAISFQVAAGVLEFIIIFYYSLTSWLHLLGEERFEGIPSPVRFFSIFVFTSFAVIFTHFIGKSFREKWKLNVGMILSGATVLAVFFYIVYISIQTGELHPA